MKKKFLLPMMAFVFAVGLSFATERSTADLDEDWIKIGETMRAIPEVDCGAGAITCVVEHPDGNLYEVYDAEFDTSPKKGNGVVIKL